MTTADPEQTKARWSPVSIASVVAAVAIAGVSCFREIYENDVGWHLALGRVFATKGLVFENALAWTARHYHWYPTSWLFDWLSWQSYSRLGAAGAQGLTLVLMLLVIAGLTVAMGGRRAGVALVVLPATILLLVPRLSPRPHVATWVIVAWTLAFARLARDRSWRWRLAAIPLISLGSNLHQGAGLATGVLGLFCIEAAWRDRRWIREGLIALGGVLALLAIPGLYENILSIRDHLHLDDVLQLVEYRAPTLTGPTAQPIFFLMLGLFAVVAWILRKEQPALIAATAVVAAMAFLHGQRWIFEFFLLLAPLLALASARLKPVSPGLFVTLLSAVALASDAREASHFVVGARWDRTANPVRAVDFLNGEGLSGRLFNGYHDGGYLALAFPRNGIYMDSRPLAFPPRFFSKEMMVETNQPLFLKQMRANDVEIAVTGNYGATLTGTRLFDSAEWALVYWDEVNEVYLRRDVPRFAGKIAELELRTFRPTDPVTALESDVVEVLAAYEREVQQVERYSPAAPPTRWARCRLAEKKQAPDAPALCAGL